MKLYFEEVLKRLTPLSREIMQTDNNEIFKVPTLTDEKENPYWDIKLTINSVEFNPRIFESLFTHTEDWINLKAKEEIKDKLEIKLYEAEQKINNLMRLLENTVTNLKEEFGTEEDNY